MKYKDKINKIAQQIPTEIVNLKLKRKRGTPPTQAFSDFLTHNEQGDWAESLLFHSLKKSNIDLMPVRYGKSDKIIAGDPNFKDFYNDYQDELDSIGKRPDILFFDHSNYDENWGDDISYHSQEELLQIVPNATAGFEVRSSSYLTKKYIAKERRPYLSFTPKAEDLLVVLKWIEIFNVPHFYVQVFFDAIYIISFSEILSLLVDSEISVRGRKNKKYIGFKNDEKSFVVEKNPKNQFKETIHIFLNNGHLLSDEVIEPNLIGQRKELSGGRLLHHVSFEGGQAIINEQVLANLMKKES